MAKENLRKVSYLEENLVNCKILVLNLKSWEETKHTIDRVEHICSCKLERLGS